MNSYTFKDAFNFYQKREFLESEKICIKILKESPNNFEVINLYAVLLFQKKNYKEAITFYKTNEFKEIGLRKNYYKLYDGRENALIFSKKIRNDSFSLKQIFYVLSNILRFRIR